MENIEINTLIKDIEEVKTELSKLVSEVEKLNIEGLEKALTETKRLIDDLEKMIDLLTHNRVVLYIIADDDKTCRIYLKFNVLDSIEVDVASITTLEQLIDLLKERVIARYKYTVVESIRVISGLTASMSSIAQTMLATRTGLFELKERIEELEEEINKIKQEIEDC